MMTPDDTWFDDVLGTGTEAAPPDLRERVLEAMRQEASPVATSEVASRRRMVASSSLTGRRIATLASVVLVVVAVATIAWLDGRSATELSRSGGPATRPADGTATQTAPPTSNTTTTEAPPPTSTTTSSTTTTEPLPTTSPAAGVLNIDPVFTPTQPPPIVNEPTVRFRDDVDWWMPVALPDGWWFEWAYQQGPQYLRVSSVGRWVDISFGRAPEGTGPTIDVGGETWIDASVAPDITQFQRVTEGTVLEVSSVNASRHEVLEIVETLERRPEVELERPPLVYTWIPADYNGAGTVVVSGQTGPQVAETDGAYTKLGTAQPAQVTRERPLSFAEISCGSFTREASGIVHEDVATIEFVLVDGRVIDVQPSDSSNLFAENFFIASIDVNDCAGLAPEVETVIARDAHGDELARYNEPF